jgi:hypothetical protein
MKKVSDSIRAGPDSSPYAAYRALGSDLFHAEKGLRFNAVDQ